MGQLTSLKLGRKSNDTNYTCGTRTGDAGTFKWVKLSPELQSVKMGFVNCSREYCQFILPIIAQTPINNSFKIGHSN